MSALAPVRPTLDEQARRKIKHWITQSGATQEEVAVRVGRTPGWLSRYLKGDFDTDLETLLAFTEAFEHPFSALFDDPGDNPTEQKLIADWRALPRDARVMVSGLVAMWAQGHRPPRRTKR